MPFELGNKYGKGRPKKAKTQAKDWIKAHPYAVSTLMDVLYKEGIKGDIESAKYVVDRIQGKPKQQTDIDLTGGEKLGTGLVVELFQLLAQKKRELDRPDTYLIEGGNDAIQGFRSQEEA